MADLFNLPDELVLVVLSKLKRSEMIMFMLCSRRCASLATTSITESAVTWMDFADDMGIVCDREVLEQWQGKANGGH